MATGAGKGLETRTGGPCEGGALCAGWRMRKMPGAVQSGGNGGINKMDTGKASQAGTVVSRGRWRFGEIARKPKGGGSTEKVRRIGITSAVRSGGSSEDKTVNQSMLANRQSRRQNRNGGSRESRGEPEFHGIEQATSEGLFRGGRTHEARSREVCAGWERRTRRGVRWNRRWVTAMIDVT